MANSKKTVHPEHLRILVAAHVDIHGALPSRHDAQHAAPGGHGAVGVEQHPLVQGWVARRDEHLRLVCTCQLASYWGVGGSSKIRGDSLMVFFHTGIQLFQDDLKSSVSAM